MSTARDNNANRPRSAVPVAGVPLPVRERRFPVWPWIVVAGLLVVAGATFLYARFVHREAPADQPVAVAKPAPPRTTDVPVAQSSQRSDTRQAADEIAETSAGSETREPPVALASNTATSDELVLEQTAAAMAQHEQSMDPRADGWDTEALNSAANRQWKSLTGLLSHGATLTAAQVAPYVTEDFLAGPLIPRDLRVALESELLTVQRGPASFESTSDPSFATGPAGFAVALAELLAPLADDEHRHVKFKQFKIERTASGFTTMVYFHVAGHTESGLLEQNATWRCDWRRDRSTDEQPRLARIEVSDFERVTMRTAGNAWFADCTGSAVGHLQTFREQLSYGVGYWQQQLPANLNVQYHGHLGLAVADANGDGRDDIYVCQPGGLPNCLLIHQADGTVVDMAADAGVDILNYTRGALFADLDNDGDQDLAASVTDHFVVFANDGAARFTLAAKFPTIRGSYGISAADYDNDGDLDLYVCRHVDDESETGEFPIPYPYYDANNGGRNVLLRNDGVRSDGGFKLLDVTAEVGLDVDNRRFTLATSWEDYDNDGDLDLYVANDFGRNCLYRNDGGTFASVARETGLEDTGFGMSVSWADFNRDGLMDLYVGNMFSAAGNRITFQEQFKPDVSADARAKYQRTARGNSLFVNQGDGTFRDTSVEAGVTMGRWSWSSPFIDINNDGWEDLLVTNGYVTGDTVDDL